MNPVPATARALGRAGLLPFGLAPVLIFLLPDYHAEIGEILALYTFAVITFLLGIWWGMSLIRGNAGALLMSNGIFLAAVAGRTLLTVPWFLMLGAVLLGVILLVERWHGLFRRQPGYYAQLRVELTGVAVVALLISSGAIGTSLLT